MSPNDKLTIEQVKAIIADIKAGNFTVEYEAPDGCELRNGPDGTPYIVISPVEDGVRSCASRGSCDVKVQDYDFYLDGDDYSEWDSSFYRDLLPTYKYKNGKVTTNDKLWDKVTAALDKSDKIIFPPYYECPEVLYRLEHHLRDDIEGIWIDDYEALFRKSRYR